MKTPRSHSETKNNSQAENLTLESDTSLRENGFKLLQMDGAITTVTLKLVELWWFSRSHS